MKILNIQTSTLYSEEHYQFHKEFKELLTKVNTRSLNIDKEYTAYRSLFSQENEILQVLSLSTEKIVEADIERDELYRGMADAIKSAIKHFNPGKCAAAMNLHVILDRYGDVFRKSYNEETIAIYKLVQEIQDNYSHQADFIGISDWVSELKIRNLGFNNLMNTRFSEESLKIEFQMKLIRLDLDEVYHTIIKKLNAWIVIRGVAGNEDFVRQLNICIEKHNNLVALRKCPKIQENKPKQHADGHIA